MTTAQLQHKRTEMHDDDGASHRSDENNSVLNNQNPSIVLQQQLLYLNQITLSLKQQTTEIYNVINSSSSSLLSPSSFSPQFNAISLLLLSLKPLNKNLQLGIEQRKSSLYSQYKYELDALNIEYASWTYEKQYFLKEIQNQQQQQPYDDQALQLKTLEEFQHKLQSANSASNSTATNTLLHTTDPHLLYVARLQDELAERQRLVQEFQSLQQEKQQLTANLQQQEQHLNQLHSQLISLVQSTDQLSSIFYPTPSEQQYQPLPDNLTRLPSSLYQLYQVIYNHLVSFGDQYQLKLKIDETRKEKTNEQLHQRHELSIMVTIVVSTTITVYLYFHWLPLLQLITVTQDVRKADQPLVGVEKEVCEPLLINLYPADSGIVIPSSPLPALLSSSSAVSPPSPQENSPRSAPSPTSALRSLPLSLGVPYYWCQSVAGLSYPHPAAAQYNVQVAWAEVLEKIVQRVEIRLSLVKQIISYTNIHTKTPATQTHSPSTNAAILTSFSKSKSKTASSKDSLSLSGNSIGASIDWISCGSLYYTALFSRLNPRSTPHQSSLMITAQIEIPAEYPIRPSVFTLTMSHPQSDVNIASSQLSVNELESRINTMSVNPTISSISTAAELLTQQLKTVQELVV